MKNIERYEIPEEIRDDEFGEYSASVLSKYADKLKDARLSKDGYKNAYTSMIHMEEAAQMQKVQMLNLKNIKIRQSSSEHVLQIEHSVS